MATLCPTVVSPQLVWPKWLEVAGTTWLAAWFWFLLDSLVLHITFSVAGKFTWTFLSCLYLTSLSPSSLFLHIVASLGSLTAWWSQGSWISRTATGFPQGRGYKILQGFLKSGLRSHRFSHLPYSVDQANHWSQPRFKMRGTGFHLSVGGVAKNYISFIYHTHI